ncbi:MAG TPA: ubiquinone/menaquinone biosynthesis methyltransferase [Chloroflexota bacterium]|nr:ubiquinone/menaquinone biosynthesis methyltransferase [Chloroflexota bacterium]
MNEALPARAEKARFVRGMFDAIAARYDVMNRLMTGGQDERWRALAAEAVLPEAVEVVLDIGAGTGDLALAVARRAPYARVVALDFSPNMLSLARRKAAATATGSHVLPVLADTMALPLRPESVDAVVSGFTLRNVDDVPTVFGELEHVLKPGGRAALLELTPVRRSPMPGFGRLFDLYFGGVVPVLGGLVSGRGFAYRYLPNSVKVFPDAERLAALLRDAGLSDVAYRLLALGTVALHTASKALLEPTVVAAPALTRRSVADAREWDDQLAGLPNGHLLQTWEWGELKRETGWVPHRLVFERAGAVVAAASVSVRRLPRTPLSVAYCQKGPAVDYADASLLRAVLQQLELFAREQGCIFVRVDPDVEWHQTSAVAAIRDAGYVPTAPVQARSTVFVSLDGDDKELLRRMSATWRRHINKGQREGVTVRSGTTDDIPRFFELMQDTERRQGYVIRPLEYYRSAFARLHEAGIAELFLGEVGGRAEAAVFACKLGRRAWYLYGGATEVGLESHAAKLVQWHTMRWARDAGCEIYDMWGAPDDPSDKDDPLSGVYYFKRGFGGRHVRTVGAYDRVLSPARYALVQHTLPRYLALLRRMKGERTAAQSARDGD